MFENENGSFQQLQEQIEGVTYAKRLSKARSCHKFYPTYFTVIAKNLRFKTCHLALMRCRSQVLGGRRYVKRAEILIQNPGVSILSKVRHFSIAIFLSCLATPLFFLSPLKVPMFGCNITSFLTPLIIFYPKTERKSKDYSAVSSIALKQQTSTILPTKSS